MSIFRSKIFKFFVFSILGIFLLFIIFAASLPSILSTKWGKEKALAALNATMKGSVSIQELQLSWFGRQKIEGFSYKDASSKEAFAFQSFHSDSPLFRLLACRYDLGHATLLQPTLHLTDLTEEGLKVQRALTSRKRSKIESVFPSICGDIDIQGGLITLDGPRLEPITLSDLSIQLKEDPKIFHIVGKTRQGTVQGELLISGNLGERVHVMAEVQQFPVALLDQLGGTPLYSSAIGRTLTLKLDLLRTENQFTLSGKVDAANLKGSFQGKTKGDVFSLDPSSELTLSVTPSFFGQLFRTAHANAWALASKTDMTIKIKELRVPLASEKNTLSQMPFIATLSLQRAELAHQKAGMFSLNNMQASLTNNESLHLTYSGEIQGKGARSKIEGWADLTPEGKVTFATNSSAFPTDLLDLVTDDAAYLRRVLGNNFSLSLGGTLENDTLSSSIAIGSVRLQLAGTANGPLEDLDLALAGKVLLTNKEEEIYGPSPTVKLEADGVFKEGRFAIPRFTAEVENAYWNTEVAGKLGEKGKPFQYSQIYFKAKGVVHGLPLESATVETGDFSIVFDGQKNRIDGDAKLYTAIEGVRDNRALQAAMHVEGFIQEGKLDFSASKATFDGHFRKFPVALLIPFVGDLRGLIGPSIDLRVESKYVATEEPKWTLDVDGSASGLKMRLAVALSNTLKVQQDKSAFIRWEMTPSRYQALMQLLNPGVEPDFVLMHKAAVSLNISQFTCPTTPPKTVSAFLCQSGFVGDIDFGRMLFTNRKTGKQLAFKNVRSKITGGNFSKAIEVLASGDIEEAATPQGERSGFNLEGTLLGLWTPEGGFDKRNLSFKGDLKLDYVPVHSITSLIPIDTDTRRYLQAILGELVNARIYGQIAHLSGPLTVDIKSSNFKATLPIQLNDGLITLREQVDAELTLTPALNEIWLVDINPLLITGAWSDHPIRLSISPDGFSVPIENYSLKRVQIPNMVIDLGKIRVRNGGDIQALMQFLQAKEVSPDGMMDAWFTPIYVSLVDGTSYYQRFDLLLAGSVHIAFWGRIDLVSNKVRMTLGISPTTLERRFKVKGLATKDMFQVKMRGRTNNLELDWSSAKTRIGIIITKSAAGGLGAIVGGLLEQILSALGEEPTPPPTTQPFPWNR